MLGGRQRGDGVTGEGDLQRAIAEERMEPEVHSQIIASSLPTIPSFIR